MTEPKDPFDRALEEILGERAHGLREDSVNLLRLLWDRAIHFSQPSAPSPSRTRENILEGLQALHKYHYAWQQMHRRIGLEPQGSDAQEWQAYGDRRDKEKATFASTWGEPVLCHWKEGTSVGLEELSVLVAGSIQSARLPIRFLATPLDFLPSLHRSHLENPHSDQIKLPVDEQPIYGYFFGTPVLMPYWLERTMYSAHRHPDGAWLWGRLVY